ncbi:alpha/beta hydrolase [Gloeocapsa sp. PCC 73106]|uniref:alpha/beta hydrolase n=1 Tax=Gloeocapsa sp. PCC 73106 TaxID=102232 RepID=UPI0002ABE41F|nr:esterase [Gloeocapsa sp. PCC 73106]ELR97071.1 putative esterase [Gloeocapsa sp. PCC 73106]
MSINYLDFPPSSGDSPTGLLILLHGWGANSQDLAGLTTMLNLPHYQILCPDAPFAHPQVPGGKAWYALDREDYQGLNTSRVLLSDWIQSLEASTNVPLHQTILAGFSQGGAMTLDVGLSLPLGGLCVLSGYLHAPPNLHDSHPPVLMIHGQQDQVVPIEAAKTARDELNRLGVYLEYHELNMGHEITSQAIVLIQGFIDSRRG